MTPGQMEQTLFFAAFLSLVYFFYKIFSWGTGTDPSLLPTPNVIFYGNDNLVEYAIQGIQHKKTQVGNGIVDLEINNAHVEVDNAWVANHVVWD
jgi:hypothetical protein